MWNKKWTETKTEYTKLSYTWKNDNHLLYNSNGQYRVKLSRLYIKQTCPDHCNFIMKSTTKLILYHII